MSTQLEQARDTELLKAYRALLTNDAWQEVARIITKAHVDHLGAVSDRALTPDQRAEHVEAYHLAKTLDEHFAKRTKDLEKRLTAAAQAAGEVSGDMADLLS